MRRRYLSDSGGLKGEKMKKVFDRQITEAEENALIDIQFLIQELILEKGVSRAGLAERAGISAARLSQIFSSEANPTAKTCARLIHALGEKLAVTTERKLASCPAAKV